MNLLPFKTPQLDPFEKFLIKLMVTCNGLQYVSWLYHLPTRPLLKSLHELSFVGFTTLYCGCLIMIIISYEPGEDE